MSNADHEIDRTRAAAMSLQHGVRIGESRLNYSLSEVPAHAILTDCVVVTLDSSGRLSEAAHTIDSQCNGKIRRLFADGLLDGELGSALLVPYPDNVAARMVLVVGSGDADCSQQDFSRLVRTAYQNVAATGAKDAAIFLSDLPVNGRNRAWCIREQVIAIEDEVYAYRVSAADEASGATLREVTLYGSSDDAEALQLGQAFAVAASTAKTLADMPPNLCTPTVLAASATSLAEKFASVSTEILGEHELLDLGMHAFLSVGQGSREESKFAIAKYSGGNNKEPPIVLIGKGVTFDTGGTTMKSREGMRLMKYDMAGAAVVLGVLHAVALLDLPINLIVIAACAENMPDGSATRPSDTVTSMSGTTVEILNPDAEGRLLLCDALTYVERFAPQLVVDVATLTGASLVALGRHYSAMFASSEKLAQAFADAGEQSSDKVWRLPLSHDDLPQLDSEFADIANIGDGTAGCVVAALFLSRFAENYPWVHLDVSGTAKKHGDSVGATGRPTALLLQYLLTQLRH